TAHAVHNVLSTILMGKRLDCSWDGWIPRIRLVPEPLEDDEGGAPVPFADTEGTEATEHELEEPVSPEADSQADGPDDGDSAKRDPE
ncbi:MAG TPA: hypothetical protein VD902_22440, partial [Symbiobacteriaceae bacterium]|nr:hypothetical protein [Symbiobacteriaceae bacterium]